MTKEFSLVFLVESPEKVKNDLKTMIFDHFYSKINFSGCGVYVVGGSVAEPMWWLEKLKIKPTQPA